MVGGEFGVFVSTYRVIGWNVAITATQLTVTSGGGALLSAYDLDSPITRAAIGEHLMDHYRKHSARHTSPSPLR
jgi:hypothetical protein